ncbi:MAG TPA: hypothetical protein VHZ24_20665 [Pirellulales bacterium]|jgi:hypothetical protein|nr:hypothetical protein [Pirellulales bacterium]
MIRLAAEQQRDVAANNGPSPRAVDPATSTEYVLVRAEIYERLKPLFEDDPPNEVERTAQLHEFGRRAGWEDASVADYDDLRRPS